MGAGQLPHPRSRCYVKVWQHPEAQGRCGRERWLGMMQLPVFSTGSCTLEKGVTVEFLLEHVALGEG